MRRLQTILIALFAVTLILFGGNFIRGRFFSDHTAPQITADSDTVYVDATLSEEEQHSQLMAGLSASDETDGDITADIRLASLSRFAADGSRTAAYIVFDKADHSATLTRTVFYNGYAAPKIYSSQPFRVQENEVNDMDPSKSLTAEDMIDGDLTSQVRFSFKDDIYSAIAGEYDASLSVSNSGKDTRTIPIKYTVVEGTSEEREKYYPLLSDYIVYTYVGQEINAYDYLIGYEQNQVQHTMETDPETAEVIIGGTSAVSNVDYSTPGVYTVDFYYTSSNTGLTGVTTLYVVVDEGQEQTDAADGYAGQEQTDVTDAYTEEDDE